MVITTGCSSVGLPAAEQLSKEHQSNIHHSGSAGPPIQLQGIARVGGRAVLVKQLKRNRNVKPYLVWEEIGTARERQRNSREYGKHLRVPEPCPAGNFKQPFRQVRVNQLCFRLLSEEASSGKRHI